MRIYAYLVLVLLVSVVTGSAWAQDAAEPQSAESYLMENKDAPAAQAVEADKAEEKKEEVAEKEVEKPVESPDMIAKKLELARKMHQIRSTREQVDSAIEQASKGMPDDDRKAFVTAMKSVLNYNAIEKISVDAMVDTFTLPELEAMVEYFSKPEAQSVSSKMAVWAKKVQPEVVRMIDAAMMRVKTGGTE